MKDILMSLLGYKSKIVVIKTDAASEFFRFGITKISITHDQENVVNKIPCVIFSWWNKSEIRVIYCRDLFNINTYQIGSNNYLFFNKKLLKEFPFTHEQLHKNQ